MNLPDSGLPAIDSKSNPLQDAIPPASAFWHPRYWLGWFVVGFAYTLGRLPFPLLWALGQGLGRLAYHLAASRREVARRNLDVCLADTPAAERERILRAHFGCLGVATLAQGVTWGISRRRLRRLVRLRHREVLDACLSSGRPVIVLAPHFMGLELAAAACAGLVHPGVYMYQRLGDPVVNRQVMRARRQYGSIPIERSDDLRGLIRMIRGGTPFFYLPDQDAGRRGIFAPFCGVPASTAPMLGRFAALTGAAVIPAFARFLPWGRGLELAFDAPLSPFPSGDQQADTALMNRVIEARIHSMPEQYFWVHRRFKTRPPGAPLFYPPKRRRS